MPLKGITSQKAKICNTKSPDAREFTLAQSIHFKIHTPRIKQRRLLWSGGKLIIYHGWSDSFIAPRNSIAYYQSVEAAQGGEKATQDFLRLFMVPAMMHCGGGSGPNTFDALTALENWAKRGQAPASIPYEQLTPAEIATIPPRIDSGEIPADRVLVFKEALKPGGKLPLLDRPEDLRIVVVGGVPGYTFSMSYFREGLYAPTSDQTKLIRGATLTKAGH